jgi:FMN-dependent NADH-azoreductase
LIEELLAADVLVIGAPMYNLSVSSSLKAWIDHVARAGATFKYTENGPVGLVTGRKAYVFTARSWHPNAFNSLPGSARSRRR